MTSLDELLEEAIAIEVMDLSITDEAAEAITGRILENIKHVLNQNKEDKALIINNFIASIDNKLYNKIRSSQSDAECRRYLKANL